MSWLHACDYFDRRSTCRGPERYSLASQDLSHTHWSYATDRLMQWRRRETAGDVHAVLVFQNRLRYASIGNLCGIYVEKISFRTDITPLIPARVWAARLAAAACRSVIGLYAL